MPEPVALHAQTWGAPGRPAVVIVHGLLGSSKNWSSRAEALSDDYFVIAPDLRNHGLSPHHAVMDYPAMVADLIALLDHYELENAHIVGHSMGGKVAMGLSLAHPGRTHSLTVVDMAPRRYAHGLDEFVEALLDVDLSRAKSRSDVDKALSASIADRRIRLFLLTNLAWNNDRLEWRPNLPVLLSAYAHISEDVEAVFPERRYDGNVLFLHGTESDYVRSSDRTQIMRLFPQARLVALKDAGHWIHAEQPEAFDQVLRTFLSDCSA